MVGLFNFSIDELDEVYFVVFVLIVGNENNFSAVDNSVDKKTNFRYYLNRKLTSRHQTNKQTILIIWGTLTII